MNNKKIIIIFLCLFSYNSLGYSIPAQQVIHHVIIMIDSSNSMVKHSDALYALLKQDIDDLCFKENIIINDRALLQKGDYFSCLRFNLVGAKPDFKKFIKQVSDINNNDYYYNTQFSRKTFHDISIALQSDKIIKESKQSYTGLSYCMPLGLYKLGRPMDDTICINKTFIILLTDDVYSGNDPVHELNYISKKVKSRYRKKVINDDFMLRTYKEIQSRFIWEEKAINFIDRRIENKINASPIKIKIFEFIPSARAFAIESLLQFNTTGCIMYRKPFMNYNCHFLLQPIFYNDSEFSILHANVSLIDNDNHVVDNNTTTLNGVESKQSIDFTFNKARNGQDLQLNMRFSVKWKNQYYGVHVLYPSGHAAQGKAGLVRKLPVIFEPYAKIYSFIPIAPVMFELGYAIAMIFKDPVQSDVKLVWEIIFIFIIIGIFIFGIICIRKNSIIKEGKINEQQIKWS